MFTRLKILKELLVHIRVFILSVLQEPTYVADALFAKGVCLPKTYWRFTILKLFLGSNIEKWPGPWAKNFCPTFWLTNGIILLALALSPLLLVAAFSAWLVVKVIIPASLIIGKFFEESPEHYQQRVYRRFKARATAKFSPEFVVSIKHPSKFLKELGSRKKIYFTEPPHARLVSTEAIFNNLLAMLANAFGVSHLDMPCSLSEVKNPIKWWKFEINSDAHDTARVSTDKKKWLTSANPLDLPEGYNEWLEEEYEVTREWAEDSEFTLEERIKYLQAFEKRKEELTQILKFMCVTMTEETVIWDVKSMDFEKICDFYKEQTLGSVDYHSDAIGNLVALCDFAEEHSGGVINFSELAQKAAEHKEEIKKRKKEKEDREAAAQKILEEKKAIAKAKIAARSAKMAKAVPYFHLTFKWVGLLFVIAAAAAFVYFLAAPIFSGLAFAVTAICKGVIWFFTEKLTFAFIWEIAKVSITTCAAFAIAGVIAYYLSDVLLEIIVFLEKFFPEQFLKEVNKVGNYQTRPSAIGKFGTFVMGLSLQCVLAVGSWIAVPFVILSGWIAAPFLLLMMMIKQNCPAITLDSEEDKINEQTNVSS